MAFKKELVNLRQEKSYEIDSKIKYNKSFLGVFIYVPYYASVCHSSSQTSAGKAGSLSLEWFQPCLQRFEPKYNTDS